MSGCTTAVSNFVKAHLKALQQVALTRTSNCIHEEEGKYISVCIQMLATNISNSSQPFTKVFSCLQAGEVTSFSQVSMAATSDSNARLPDTVEHR